MKFYKKLMAGFMTAAMVAAMLATAVLPVQQARRRQAATARQWTSLTPMRPAISPILWMAP